ILLDQLPLSIVLVLECLDNRNQQLTVVQSLKEHLHVAAQPPAGSSDGVGEVLELWGVVIVAVVIGHVRDLSRCRCRGTHRRRAAVGRGSSGAFRGARRGTAPWNRACPRASSGFSRGFSGVSLFSARDLAAILDGSAPRSRRSL